MTWQRNAACKGQDSSLFFPERGTMEREAKAICAQCSVKQECLEFGLRNLEHGVWGGTSEVERKRMRRVMRFGPRSVREASAIYVEPLERSTFGEISRADYNRELRASRA